MPSAEHPFDGEVILIKNKNKNKRARMRRSYLYKVRKRMHSVTVHPESRGIMPLMPNSPAENGAGLYVSRVFGL